MSGLEEDQLLSAVLNVKKADNMLWCVSSWSVYSCTVFTYSPTLTTKTSASSHDWIYANSDRSHPQGSLNLKTLTWQRIISIRRSWIDRQPFYVESFGLHTADFW